MSRPPPFLTKFMNNPTLHDVILLATLSPNDQHDDLHESTNNNAHNCTNPIDTEPSDIVFGHWDILRAHSAFFERLYDVSCSTDVCPLMTEFPIGDGHRTMTVSVTSGDDNTPRVTMSTTHEALSLAITYLYTGKIRERSFMDPRASNELLVLAQLFELPRLYATVDRGTTNGHLRLIFMNALHTDDFTARARRIFLEERSFCGGDDHQQSSRSMARVNCNGHMFWISRVYFAAVSDYFHAMFVHGFSEALAAEIELPNIGRKDFEQIEHFVYTNDIDRLRRVSFRRLKRLFHFSLYFQMDTLTTAIETTIATSGRRFLSHDTFVELWELGCEHPKSELKRMCREYFQNHFGEIADQPSKFVVVPKNVLKDALKDGRVGASTECMIRALCVWADHRRNTTGEVVDLCELLPPNTMFNAANKEYILHSRQIGSVGHLLRLA